jgi:hypothetical protein
VALAGTPLPIQARALNHWADGSLKWVLVDLQIDAAADGDRIATLAWSRDTTHGNRVLLSTYRENEGIRIDTGTCQILAKPHCGPICTVTRDDLPPAELALEITDAHGRRCDVSVRSVEIEEAGPLRAALALSGFARCGDREFLTLIVRLHAYAGHSVIRCDVTLRNSRRARHHRGNWDLGDPGSALVSSASLIWRRPAASVAPIWCSPEIGSQLETMEVPFSIHQASSGGENWRSTNHVNSRREIPLSFRGYSLLSGSSQRQGIRATPIVVLGSGPRQLAMTAEYFWQNFPKRITSDGRGLAFHLFPAHDAEAHEIQAGEQKTHTVHVLAGEDHITTIPLDWSRNPVAIKVDPEYICATGAVPYLTPEAGDPDPEYVALVNAAIAGSNTFDHKREVIDEFGWRHFGDVYGDHEAVFHAGASPLVSHYNNQYDAIAGFAYQFLRSGNIAWWRHMRELAWHVADIDIYHTDRDKPLYNRGLFWHTIHYHDADTATHRSYPKTCGHGGGPAGEHNYATGLALAWCLTGERLCLDAALDLVAYPIRIDDGTKTPFRWLASGATGLATASGHPLYHGPGRGSANSLNSLIDGYQLTADRQFIDKAEQIIRRVVHPEDDIAARDLLDAERKWFYTMFLQALGNYLDFKTELGERDRMYAWARASLLHYARWMTDHEYPYLDKPEILEFPTETWAAQDIRKSDVFHYAERYAATEEDRGRFRQRAAFFFQSSVDALRAAPTRALARPVIVLLTSGRLHAWFERHRDQLHAEVPLEVHDFGAPPAGFEPQKTRAFRRAKLLIVLAAVAGVIALIAVVWPLL